MTKYYTLNDRFQRELAELYDVDKNSLDLLGSLTKETKNQALKPLLQEFEQETKNNLKQLDQVYQHLGTKPEHVTGTTVLGLMQERRLLDVESAPAQEVAVWDLHAVSKILHFEVAALRSLVDTARLIGRQEVRQLLEKGLKEKEDLMHKLDQHRQQLNERQPAFAGSSSVRSDYRAQQDEA